MRGRIVNNKNGTQVKKKFTYRSQDICNLVRQMFQSEIEAVYHFVKEVCKNDLCNIYLFDFQNKFRRIEALIC